MFGDAASAFWFYGRLGPPFVVPPFNVSDVAIGDGATLEIAWEGIGVWAPAGHARFKQPGEISDLLRTVVGAWTATSGQALVVTLEGWVEATDASFSQVTMGWVSQRPMAAMAADPASELSRRMRQTCELASRAHTIAGYRLALRDLHSAHLDSGEDAFVYAYRALEDVARHVSRRAGQLGAEGWASFHEHLGLEADQGRAELDPLKRARDAIVHGDREDVALSYAHQRREELLLDARRRVLRAMALDDNIGVEIEAALPPNDPWAVRPDSPRPAADDLGSSAQDAAR